MHYFVTGAAGFIGSNLCDRLLQLGHRVTGFDNMSTGQHRFLEVSAPQPGFTLIRSDLYEDRAALTAAMAGADFVFHLAANADVRFGTSHPRRDLEQNTIVTWNVLEAMRANGIKSIGFSSTGSVYGEPNVHPTPEDGPFPVQTSLYGASKLASEGCCRPTPRALGVRPTSSALSRSWASVTRTDMYSIFTGSYLIIRTICIFSGTVNSASHTCMSRIAWMPS
jgi:UDP-glucose 4-epimerase